MAPRDHHFVVFPNGYGPHVVLGSKVFTEWGTHDLSSNDRGGTEVSLATLSPRRTHSRIELHFVGHVARGWSYSRDVLADYVTIEIAQF